MNCMVIPKTTGYGYEQACSLGGGLIGSWIMDHGSWLIVHSRELKLIIIIVGKTPPTYYYKMYAYLLNDRL